MLLVFVCLAILSTLVFSEMLVNDEDTSVTVLTSVICMPNVGKAGRFLSPAAAIARA